MNDFEKHALGCGYCPDCLYRGFVLGPRGGVSLNIECGNVDCRSRFNIVVVPFYTPEVVFAQRIPKASEGGAPWGEPVIWPPRP